MPWTQTDTSFKKLSNKRITTSVGKGLPEEKGASTLELYLPDIKTGLIPGTGFAGFGISGYLYYHGPTAAFGQTLVVDTSVPGNLTWFATAGWANTTLANDGSALSESQRLGDWVSDKYDAFGTVPGAGYEIKVYDRNNNLITKSDNSNWLFDYQTGILVFNNDTTSISTLISTSGPFRIVGWRYIGPKGIIPASYGGLGYTSYNLGDLIVGAGSTIITLPVGSNNYILSADSSTPSGLKWIVNTGSGLGISYLNNLNAGQQYFATGTSGVGFNISSSGSTHTFNIPIAGIGFTGLVSGIAQTFGGTKTFSEGLISSFGATIYGSLHLPNNPLEGLYGGTGYTNYGFGDLLVGSGSTLIKLPAGADGYVLSSHTGYPSGLGWTTVVGVAVSIDPPAGPKHADLWWNSYDGSLSIYYDDVDTNQWVEVVSNNNIDWSQPIHITSAAGSTNQVTGALVVDGGIGVGGAVNVDYLGINGNSDIFAIDLTTSSTSTDQVFHAIDSTTYRSAKYFIQIKSGSVYQAEEIIVLHDGTDAYLSEFALVRSGVNLSAFNADVSGGNLRLLVTPVNSVTTYKATCTGMRD
jgi:hypothetical protein